jgi:hypothetical protein
MADHTWPETLPSAPLIGWTEQIGKNTIRSETEAGPAKLRRRFTSAPSNFVLKMSMTETQANAFMTFFETTLASGVKTFDNLAHPRLGLNTTEWRFLEEPILLYMEYNVYAVSFRLEALT